jgi:hypothetical protein
MYVTASAILATQMGLAMVQYTNRSLTNGLPEANNTIDLSCLKVAHLTFVKSFVQQTT